MIEAEHMLPEETLRWGMDVFVLYGWFLHFFTSLGGPCRRRIQDTPATTKETRLLLRRFFLQPLIKIVLGEHAKIGLHVVVAQPAELRAYDFVSADFCGGKMNGEIQAGHKVLLNAQFPHVEGMTYVFGVHHQEGFVVHWNRHLAGYDVIARFH